MAVRKYESLYIVKPELTDPEVQKIADRYKEVVEQQGGTVESAGKWDKRKLAYEVKGYKEGNYILMQFSAEGKVPAELSRLLGINEDVLRHRIFLIED
jgi:small subunit ribosomal protein S6